MSTTPSILLQARGPRSPPAADAHARGGGDLAILLIADRFILLARGLIGSSCVAAAGVAAAWVIGPSSPMRRWRCSSCATAWHASRFPTSPDTPTPHRDQPADVYSVVITQFAPGVALAPGRRCLFRLHRRIDSAVELCFAFTGAVAAAGYQLVLWVLSGLSIPTDPLNGFSKAQSAVRGVVAGPSPFGCGRSSARFTAARASASPISSASMSPGRWPIVFNARPNSPARSAGS